MSNGGCGRRRFDEIKTPYMEDANNSSSNRSRVSSVRSRRDVNVMNSLLQGSNWPLE